VRAALGWLITNQESAWALRLGLGLFHFWEAHEYLAEAREFLQAILQLPGNASRTAERALALSYAGLFGGFEKDFEASMLKHREALDVYRELGDQIGINGQMTALAVCEVFQGNWSEARSWYEQVLQACRALDSRPNIAATLSDLAQVISQQGDHLRARSLLWEALDIFRELGDWCSVGWSFNRLGDVARRADDVAEAREMYAKALDIFRTHGELWGYARTSGDFGSLACDEHDLIRAHWYFGECLRTFLQLGHNRGIARALEDFACLAAEENEPERCLILAGAAAALRDSIGAAARPRERSRLDVCFNAVRKSTPPRFSVALWTRGFQMPLQDAVRCALSPDSELV